MHQCISLNAALLICISLPTCLRKHVLERQTLQLQTGSGSCTVQSLHLSGCLDSMLVGL